MRRKLKNKFTDSARLAVRLLPIAFGLLLIAFSCKNKQQASSDTYICPMHPTVLSDRPGTCPVCGMDLVRKAGPGEEVEITEDLARLLKSPNETVIASLKTIKADYRTMNATLELQGVVTYDTRYTYNIPARIGGRLEKVYLKYAFQPVRKGQRVADLYSPELLTAQRELIYLLTNDSNSQLIEPAKEKLVLLGATEKQIQEIISKKQPEYMFSVFSEHDGYILSENQTAPSITASSSSSPAMGEMGDGGVSTAAAAPSITASPMETAELIREGSYVSAGQALFKVVSTSAVRVELSVPSAQASIINTGDTVLLHLDNAYTKHATVDFIQPFFTDGEAFVKIWVYVRYTEGLRIGQLVSASLPYQTEEMLWLPKEAVLDMGTHNVVFLRERGVFKPKKISTGIRINGSVEIKQGLASTDEVAANAQYLVDSESFIKSK